MPVWHLCIKTQKFWVINNKNICFSITEFSYTERMVIMAKFSKIGVLTSGGDAQGMNACLKAITHKAQEEGIEVLGVVGGYSGLIHDQFVDMNTKSVANIVGLGGTFLYSDRCLEFQTEEGMNRAVEVCKKHNIDAIIAIGGDGTFRGATDLTAHGIPTIGIPGTIDNDITATDYTIGFDTSMNVTLDMIDCLRDTCESHKRCNVVEVMGRNCGQIALETAIASGALAAVIPEVPFDEEAALAKIKQCREDGKRGMIVVVSEGVIAPDGRKFGEYFAEKIEEETGIETKFARFAHVVRGGKPTVRDRVTAAQMASAAVDKLLEGKSNLVICEFDGEIVSFDINFALITDRMYKNKLKDGDLDKFNDEQIAEMKKICEKRRKEINDLYHITNMYY